MWYTSVSSLGRGWVAGTCPYRLVLGLVVAACRRGWDTKYDPNAYSESPLYIFPRNYERILTCDHVDSHGGTPFSPDVFPRGEVGGTGFRARTHVRMLWLDLGHPVRFPQAMLGMRALLVRALPRSVLGWWMVLGGMLDERNRRDQTYRPCGPVVQSRVRLYVGSSPSARLEISRPA